MQRLPSSGAGGASGGETLASSLLATATGQLAAWLSLLAGAVRSRMTLKGP